MGASKAALRPALRTTSVSSEELQTVFAKTMGILNNFPIAYMVQSDIDIHYRPLTANHFLMGQPYSKLLEQNTGSITAAKRYRKLNEILRVFWTKLVTELTTHLRQYNTWIAETRGVKLNNIALLLDPNKRGLLPLIRITQVQRGLDDKIRKVTVFDGFTHFQRAITSLAVLVPAEEEGGQNHNKPHERLDRQTGPTRPTVPQAATKLSGN
jgi:hypothetical protein